MRTQSMGLMHRGITGRSAMRFFAVWLALATCGLCVALFGAPTHAYAATATYNIGSGSCTCNNANTDYTIVGNSTNGATVSIEGGSEQKPVRVTLYNVTIDQSSVKPSDAPVTVKSGYAVITLKGTNTLRAGYKNVALLHDWGFAGLCVQSGAACVITSADGDGSTAGSLEARGGHDTYGGAGIGTNYDEDTGTIIIRGGTIRAYGAHSAAGIGSGRDGECNTVSIEGGDVWAWGGEYAAGIGGGDAVGVSTGGWTHDVRVYAGTVHAYGGNNGGAGIGGSEGGGTDTITIAGGNITAVGCGENASKGSAAGIGSGDGKTFGSINISQGSGELTINARGYGEGAGIGSANCKSGNISISLRGGSITATGGPEAAGIGSGDDESGPLTIKGNGTIEAHAGWNSAAIGAGDQAHSGPITINGNSSRLTIDAYAPEPQSAGQSFVAHAALIGAGDGSASDISINNANINLHASGTSTVLGAGIGTGSSNDLSLKDGGIGDIGISNATIRFSGIHQMSGAGIGAGYGSNVKSITLNNVDYDGPTIGSSCSDRFGTNENSMESISIANSHVKAIARGDDERNQAGVGTGPYGTIGSIVITNSDVEAKGVHGGAGIGSGGMFVNASQALHPVTSSDGKCGSVTIMGTGTVKATGSDGGAGIGGGTLTSVEGDISISRGATVVAVGGNDGAGGGAGIGGGKLCSCSGISIDGATVTATGGPAAAGIGSGGVDDTSFISGIVQTAWNTTCGNISIAGESSVDATGGEGAAGIGLGQGAQMETGCWIAVAGGTVNARGGLRGAGIVGARQSGLNRGAEARRIRIEGESRVTSEGGAGAAGIGGGYEGGLEQCVIGLSVNDPNRAFVVARGGAGAAGIGGGASSRQSTSKGTLDGAHDAKSVSISGGFVAAYGGNGAEGSAEGRTGAGAGIGGGSYQGDLESLTISGGVVVAHAGARASGAPSGSVDAEDIGHGGSREGDGGDGSDSIYIRGGTVIGKVNENEPVLVVGGSVNHRFAYDKATRSNFELDPVYQNAIAIDTSRLGLPFVFDGKEFYSLGLQSTSSDSFHCDDVFAVVEAKDRAKAYLYLPAGATDATTAYVKPSDVALSYYGTTTADRYPSYDTNTNVLKMGAPITIVPKRRSDPLVEGVPYVVRVGDLDGGLGDGDTACYTSAEHATYEGYRMADGTTNGDVSHVPIYTDYADNGRTYTDVTVIPGAAGQTMRLAAKLNEMSAASDLYWGNGEAFFQKDIQTAPLYINIANKDALTRLYGADPVYPEFQTNGTITSIRCMGEWGTTYDKTVTSPDDRSYMPTQIGYYELTVWSERDGKRATDSASFQIVDPAAPKQPTTLTVEIPSKVYDTQPVEPVVRCSSDGEATLQYRKLDGTQVPGPPKDAGDYVVTAKVPMTATHEAASAESRFSISPKEGTLALSEAGSTSAQTATLTATLLDVYGDVSGADIVFTLDNSAKTATAQLVPAEGGAFTATCTFNEVEAGHHVAKASFASANYHVEDATAAFDRIQVQVKIVEDLTKIYDGTPVADPGVEATPGAEVAYAYSTDSGPVDRPKEPGTYRVTAKATIGESQASDERAFRINKCPVELFVNVSSKAYDELPIQPTVTATAKNGLEIEQTATFTYYQRQDDGTYGSAFTDPPKEIGDYFVRAVRPADDRYCAAEASATFSIVEAPVPYLYVDMPKTFVYDAAPVDATPADGDADARYPLVWTSSDCDRDDIVFDYYEGNEPLPSKKLGSAPTDVGDYCVVVTVPATSNYKEESCASSFSILPRPAVLGISAKGDQSTESAEVTVTITGALFDVVGKFIGIGVTYDDPTELLGTQGDDALDEDALTAQGDDDVLLAAQGTANVEAVIADTGDALAATHKFDHVGAGEYEVTASYAHDPNYAVKNKTEHFDKRMRGYSVLAEDKTVTFGDEPFAIQAEVRDTNGSEVADPNLSYAQVSGEDLPMVTDDAAVLGESGTVSVRNAGTSAIRVNVAGDDTHEGNFDYAIITVRKVPLALTVTAQDKTYDGKPAEVAYSVDDAAYPTPYGGDVALTYFRKNGEVRTQLESAPTEDGTYEVVATAAGDRNYDGAVAEADFTIRSQNEPNEPDDPDDPSDPEGPDGPSDPNDPSGPTDPEGPNKPSASADSGGSSNATGTVANSVTSTASGDSGGVTHAASTPHTADDAAVWPQIVMAALGFVVLAYSALRLGTGLGERR